MILALPALLLPLLVRSDSADVPAKPHIFFLLVDDYGWAGAGWHNDVQSGGQREVQTPNMDAMVKEGIELNQHYTFKFCSPTRSSLQSGRNPIHVNVQNVNPTRSNAADPVAGFSAIARNMTGLAVHMQAAGWATAAVGKWVSVPLVFLIPGVAVFVGDLYLCCSTAVSFSPPRKPPRISHPAHFCCRTPEWQRPTTHLKGEDTSRV